MIGRLCSVWLVAILTLGSASPAGAQLAAPGPTRSAERNAREPLDWTPRPGAFEQSLRRRHGNPLYAPSRRRVSPDELRSAIIRDAAEAREALADFMNLALQQRKLGRLDDPGDIDAAVARFEDQIRRARGVAGEASKLADELRRIRAQLMQTWREGNAQADDVQRELDEIEESQRRRAPIENNSFVAQLLRDDSPIADADLAPALLSEDIDTIELAMSQLGPKRRRAVRRDALAVVSYVRLEGAEIEGFDAKLEALSGGRRRAPGN